ncbi:MAG: chloride channel protein [Pseudobdellovibrio sp.]
MSIKLIIQSLFIGLLSGAIYLGFSNSLEYFDYLRQKLDWLVLLLPIAFICSFYIRYKTLYFPQKISDLEESQTTDVISIWNRKMSLFHYFGAHLSHLFGASVGREGVIVMVTSGFVTFMNMNLQFWIPVSAAIGFAVVTGSKWISLIFLIEMYRTTMQQKILAFIGAWAGLLLVETFKLEALFRISDFKDSSLFFDRIMFCLSMAVFCGLISYGYKKIYFYLSSQSKKHFWFSFAVVCFLSIFLYLKPFQSLQSLSLGMVQYYVHTSQYTFTDLSFIVLKIILTVLFVSLGFYGGEYVPLAVSGASLGILMASIFNVPIWFGMSLGAFLILSGVTQLKWSFLLLALILSDWNYIILFYVTFSISNRIAGEESLYYKNKDKTSIFKTNMFVFR